jgi:quercetin dioxygenase-like cupin family protein
MSNNIEVILFEKQHAYDIKLQARDEHIRQIPGFDAWINENAQGASFTGIDKSNGKILVCAGIRVTKDGEGVLWGLMCDDIGKYTKSLLTIGIAHMNALVTRLKINKLIAYVRKDQEVDIKFIKRIGFVQVDEKQEYYIFVRDYRPINLAPVLDVKDKVNIIERKMKEMPNAKYGDCFPLEHFFAKGLYVRQITVPRGALITSKIHKYSHAFFLLKGDISILQDDEGVRRLKAPCFFITPAGTKRAVYHHEDTVVITVHATEKIDLQEIEDEIIIKENVEIEAVLKETIG